MNTRLEFQRQHAGCLRTRHVNTVNVYHALYRQDRSSFILKRLEDRFAKT